MTQEYEILKGRTSTTFSGDLLSHTSSRRSNLQEFWTEYDIYRTVAGNYVVVILGKTIVPGKKLKVNIIKAITPQAVVEALKFKNKDGTIYITHTAEDALGAAAENDPGLHDIYYKNHID